MRTRCLSLHAGYRCHHTGACCTDVWAVPVEPRVIELVTGAGIGPAGGAGFVKPPQAPVTSAARVVAQHDGACVFFDAAAGRLCAIHRHLGVAALPTACRHFPRIHRRDARGMSLSLSHFCPTAAAMLLTDGPLTIVEAVPPLALEEPIEGLDAVDAWPPLLRPRLMMDLDAYLAWEEQGVATLARGEVTHSEALAVLTAATEALRAWRPEHGALADATNSAFANAWKGPALPRDDGEKDDERLAHVNAALPDGHPRIVRAREWPVTWARGFEAPLRRYLAARLFANWIAYRGTGLRTVVEWLRVCLAVLRNEIALRGTSAVRDLDESTFIESVRETDRLMLHVVEPHQLSALLDPIEST